MRSGRGDGAVGLGVAEQRSVRSSREASRGPGARPFAEDDDIALRPRANRLVWGEGSGR